MTEIILAILIGGAFGFVLDRIGATDPNWIMRMLNLSNLHLMKTILLAIGTGSVLMFGGQLAGIVDPGHMSVKTAYLGVLLGGALLGLGWALAGYCPGTGLGAFAAGRRDAAFFVLGGLVGAFAFMLSYGWIADTFLMAKIAGGKATLGAIPGTDYPSLLGLDGRIVGIVLGLVFIAIAVALPLRPRALAAKGEGREAPAEA